MKRAKKVSPGDRIYADVRQAVCGHDEGECVVRGRSVVRGTKVPLTTLKWDEDTLFPLQGAFGYGSHSDVIHRQEYPARGRAV